MTERLLLALTVGLPAGALSAVVLLAWARRLRCRLLKQWGVAGRLTSNPPACSVAVKRRLDRLLVGGLCLSPVLVLLNWGLGWFALAAAIYCAGLQVLARIDAQTHLLPDALTLPLLWAGLLFQWFGGWIALHDAVAGAAAGYAVLWLIWAAFRGCTGRDGIGFGDFKLAAATGAWLGIEALPWALLVASCVACLVTGVVACSGILSSRRPCSEPLAFGPYLALGGIVMLFCTQNSL